MKSNRRAIRGLTLCALLALPSWGLPANDDTPADLTTTDTGAESASVEPVHQAELALEALRYSPEYTRPVLRADRTPLAVYHDLNGDGRTDVALLTVLNEPGVPAELELLRETSRLFRTQAPLPLFVVETYFAGSEAVQTVELGRRTALGGMELLKLSESDPFPTAITVSTRGPAGGETNLLVYSPGGMIRRVALQETERERYQLIDLDQDGRLDIVVTRRLPEAGRGYETFMELWTLEGYAYVTSASFGVVRELQRFLSATVEHMVAGRWVAVESVVRGGEDASFVLAEAFGGVAEADESTATVFDYPQTGVTVSAVVFPGIRENPYPYPYLGTQFTLEFRVECCDAAPRLFAATVELAQNPFVEPRFAFLTGAGTRQ